MAEQFAEKRETILVVDDSAAVLSVVVAILRKANFVVLKSISGADAIKYAVEYNGHIDLLLFRRAMSAMSGPDLGNALKKPRPDLRVMLMSGMGGGNPLRTQLRVGFHPEPLMREPLLKMIDSVLRQPDKSQGTDQYNPRKHTAGLSGGNEHD